MTTSLPTGSDSITAQYSGDSNYAASTTPAITVNVSLQPDFTFSFAPATISVTSPGLSGTTMLTVTGSNGFSGATNFSCAGLPSESSCSFMPPTVTGSGATTLTVTTTAPSSVVPGNRNNFPNWRPASASLRSLVLCTGLLVLGICVRRRRSKVIGGGIIALMLIIGLAACGGGGGGGVGVTPPANPGTPMVQNQTVTVTATSGTLTHTTTFTLNVN